MLERMPAILSPPRHPRAAGSPSAWRDAEKQLGTSLPTDYKGFVRRYGSGYIDDFLWVFSPFEDHANVNLLRQLDEQREVHRLLRDALGDDEMPFGFSPDPGGLLPWGRTDDGDALYWVTRPPDPDRWPVLLERDVGWQEFEVPMTRFLEDLLTGLRRPFGGDSQTWPTSPLPLRYGLPWAPERRQ